MTATLIEELRTAARSVFLARAGAASDAATDLDELDVPCLETWDEARKKDLLSALRADLAAAAAPPTPFTPPEATFEGLWHDAHVGRLAPVDSFGVSPELLELALRKSELDSLVDRLKLADSAARATKRETATLIARSITGYFALVDALHPEQRAAVLVRFSRSAPASIADRAQQRPLLAAILCGWRSREDAPISQELHAMVLAAASKTERHLLKDGAEPPLRWLPMNVVLLLLSWCTLERICRAARVPAADRGRPELEAAVRRVLHRTPPR